MRKYFADVGIKTHTGHIKKPQIVKLGRVDRFNSACIDCFYGFNSINGYLQKACEAVARAVGDDPQRFISSSYGRCGFVNGAIAANGYYHIIMQRTILGDIADVMFEGTVYDIVAEKFGIQVLFDKRRNLVFLFSARNGVYNK